jgi:hypothetical protein
MHSHRVFFRMNSVTDITIFTTLEVPTALTMKTTVFWDVTPCNLVHDYQNVLPQFSGQKNSDVRMEATGSSTNF